MLRLLVPAQVHFPLEAFPAEVTAERFEARVLPAVRDEIGALAEGLPAHLTLVRLLPCSRSETVRSTWSRFTRSGSVGKRFLCGVSPVWMNVCFFMSDFWWNLFPQYWHGYGRVSEWMSRCVESVEERLKLFPQILQLKLLSCEKGVRGYERSPKPPKVALGLLGRCLPASGPLGADPSSRRVRRFSRRLRTQTAASRCASAVRGPPAHGGWRKPLKYNTNHVSNPIPNNNPTPFCELV